MIKKLTLTRFGKFVDKTFSFEDVTVFIGKNEAGKTTIFDALFDNICNISGNSDLAKKVKLRYGVKGGKSAERISNIEYEDGEFEFPGDEFLKLYAVQSGDITSSLSSGSEWVNKIQASLFTGGIDPRMIMDSLESDATTDKRAAHMKQIANKQKEKREKEEEIAKKHRERDAILSSEKELKKSGGALDAINKEIHNKEVEEKNLKDTVQLQEKIREKSKLYDVINRIKSLEENRATIESMSEYAQDRSGEARKIDKTIEEINGDISSLKTRVKIFNDEIKKLEYETGVLKSKSDAMSRKIHPLKELLEQIARDCPKPVIRQGVAWNKAVLIVGVCLAAAGFIGSAILNFNSIGLIILTAGVIAGLVLAFVSRTVVHIEENADIAPFTKKMLKRCREISEDNAGDAETIEELREYIIKFITSFEQIGRSFDENNRTLSDKKRNCKENEDELEKKKAEKENNESDLQKWLGKMKVDDLSQFMVKLNDYKTLKSSIADIERNLKKAMSDLQCDTISMLKTRAETIAAGLEKETTGEKTISDAELVKIKNKLRVLSGELEKLRKEQKGIATVVDKGAGHISGALGNIPETIRDLGLQIVKLDEEIRGLDINRRAAGFAADIFDEISKDSSMQFDIVSRDIASRFGEFMPGVGLVKIQSFDNDDILVADAGKTYRPPVQLSTGTKDAFWFAARLSLALKANPEGPGIIVLDEPFHAFDNERMKKAVSLLRKFHDDSSWQIVLFTKDEPVMHEMKTAFGGNVKVHEL